MALVLDDHERFEKAKALHTKWKSPPLQDLCMDFFINKSDVLISGWKKSGENIFELLPNSLRNDLLSYLPSYAERKLLANELMSKEQFLELSFMLMNKETVKLKESFFEFPLVGIRLDEFHRILANIAQTSPKLQNFGIRDDDDCDKDDSAENLMCPREGIPFLFQLKDLMHLEIFGFWFWKNDDLNQLFLQMKQLVVLKIFLHKTVTIDGGFQNIHLMKKLEEFHFIIGTHEVTRRHDSDESLVSMYEEIYSFCAEQVPSLKLIGGDNVDYACGDEDILYDTEFADISPIIRGTSGLEHLLTNSMLPSADFPNLQNLFFLGPLSMDQEMFCNKMASFIRLSKLYLEDLTSDVIFKMLEFVGKQLDTLNVIFQDHNFDYYQILYLCPNLATYTQSVSWPDLETYNVDPLSKYQALVTKHNVRLMKYFRAHLYEGDKVEGLFELILFAPLLEHLTLKNLTVSRAECQSVHDVLEGHFLHLKSLTLESLDLDSSCAMNDFDLFVQFLVSSAPCLCIMNLSWKDDYLSNKWETEHTVAKQFLQLLEEHFRF